MSDNPPEPGDWVMDLVAKKPREVIGRVVSEGELIKVWYRKYPNTLAALFPGEFRLLKKSQPGPEGPGPKRQA
jgi:hypothetical protein